REVSVAPAAADRPRTKPESTRDGQQEVAGSISGGAGHQRRQKNPDGGWHLDEAGVHAPAGARVG
ncbi:MAG: hypothetical protein ACK55Z_04425, partial [bacterium]